MFMLATTQKILFLVSPRSLGKQELQQIWSRNIYLEELELERERWRLRPGDLERERRRAGDRLLGERDLLLMRGGLRRHIGGGGGILRGGEGLRGGGRTL